METSSSKEFSKEKTSKIWESPFGQVVFVTIFITSVMLYAHLQLNDRALGLVLTFLSIIISVGATYYFARKSFDTALLEKQKERARIAVRRPMEIARGLRAILGNVNSSCTELCAMDKYFPDEAGRIMLRQGFKTTEESIKLLHGHVLSAIDDWVDLIGDEIKSAALFEKQFDDLQQQHVAEITKLNAKHAEENENLKSGTDAEKKALVEKFNDEKKQIEAEYEEKTSDLLKAYSTPFLPSGSIGSGISIGTTGVTTSIFSIGGKCPKCGKYELPSTRLIGPHTCPICGTTWSSL